jgi:xylulokinase
MDALIGIDVGTSGCKVIVLGLDGARLAQSARSYPIDYPRRNWAEQDPERWYQATCEAIRDCLVSGHLHPGEIKALSVTGPAHNVALLDANRRVLRPTLHWSDLRSEPQCEALVRDLGARIFEITGQRMHPSWTLPQLLWLKENEPGVWSSLAQVLVTKDYVRQRLTGDNLTDDYDAVGTMLCDLQTGAWSEEICDYLRLPTRLLPQIREAGSLAGSLSAQGARDTGLLAGTPVAVGSGDSVVEAFGAGALEPGDCLIKLGSSANVDLVTRQPMPSPKTITYPYFIDHLGFTVAATISGASSWRWFREQACTPAGGEARFAEVELMKWASAVPAGSEGLLFHPYLMGARVPYWDSSLRASFLGASTRHTLGHFARAVLEGVAFSLRDCLGAVEELGEKAVRFKLLGGGAYHPLWRQIICDVLGQPLSRPEIADASVGAALLAGRAIGAFADWQTAARVCRQSEEIIEPNQQAHAVYRKMFEVYRQSVGPLQAIAMQLRGIAEAPAGPARELESKGATAVTASIAAG